MDSRKKKTLNIDCFEYTSWLKQNVTASANHDNYTLLASGYTTWQSQSNKAVKTIEKKNNRLLYDAM